jgi:ABC-type sugar transport system substrate-binding protein
VLAVSACGSTGAKGAGDGTGKRRLIVVNMYSRALPYFQQIAAGAEEEGKKFGWNVEVTWGKTDPQLQFNQLQNAVTKQPDGGIVAPVDQEALIPAFQQAKTAGTKLVTVADDIAAKGQQNELAFVGVEYPELGKKKAQWIVDKLGGKGTVAVIHGIRGLHFSEAQFEGAKSVFDANPGIKLINGPYAGEFSADAGLKAAENVLAANPNVDALYFDNDDIALGGILAAKARNIPMNKIIIIGTDGGKPARDAVKAGDLDFTISLCGYATGVRAMDVLKDKLDSNKNPDQHVVPVPVLDFTPQTVDENNKQVDEKKC